MMIRPEKKYSMTRFQRYSKDNIEIDEDNSCSITSFNVRVDRSSSNIGPNYCRASEKTISKFKYFLADYWDFEQLDELMNECQTGDQKKRKIYASFRTLLDWSRVFRTNLYIRGIPTGYSLKHNDYRIFVEDALEIIPIILERQGTPLRDDDNRLEKYRNLWASDPEKRIFRTLSMYAMKILFEEFDCDKTLIMIVEDIHYIQTTKDYMERGSYTRTLSPNLVEVMDTSMAVLFIFDNLIMGVHHGKQTCKGHPDKHGNLLFCKDKIRKMLNYLLTIAGTYISIKYLYQTVKNFRAQCPSMYGYLEARTDFSYSSMHYNDTIEPVVYMYPAFRFGLRYFANFLTLDQSTFPTWMSRTFLALGWLQQFFTEDRDRYIREYLGNTFMTMVPDEHAERMRPFINDVVQGVISGNDEYPDLLYAIEAEEQKMVDTILTKKQKKAMKRKVRKEKKRQDAAMQNSGTPSEGPDSIEGAPDSSLSTPEPRFDHSVNDGNLKKAMTDSGDYNSDSESENSPRMGSEAVNLKGEKLTNEKASQEAVTEKLKKNYEELLRSNQALKEKYAELEEQLKKKNEESQASAQVAASELFPALNPSYILEREAAFSKLSIENVQLTCKVQSQQEFIELLIRQLKIPIGDTQNNAQNNGPNAPSGDVTYAQNSQ